MITFYPGVEIKAYLFIITLDFYNNNIKCENIFINNFRYSYINILLINNAIVLTTDKFC